MVDHHRCRGFAHVVGLGFEGQPPDCDDLAPQVAQRGLQFLENNPFLLLVDPLDGLDDLHRVAVFPGRVGQRLHVLREA